MRWRDGRNSLRRKTRKFQPYFYVLPGLIYIFATTIIPLVYSFKTSLMDDRRTSPGGPHFVGVDNYTGIFQSSSFWNSLRVTLLYTGGTVFLEMLIGTILALILVKLRRGRKLSRVLFVIPFSLPPVVVGLMYLLILDRGNGILNYLLSWLGVDPVSWLGDPSIALWTIIGIDIWQWTPFVIISALAALESMPGDVLEAAVVDGATPRQLLRWIVLPLIKPVLLIVALTRALTSLKVFDIIFVLTGGGPGGATETLSYGVYANAFEKFDFGYSSALSWLLILLAMIVAIPLVRSVLKSDNS